MFLQLGWSMQIIVHHHIYSCMLTFNGAVAGGSLSFYSSNFISALKPSSTLVYISSSCIPFSLDIVLSNKCIHSFIRKMIPPQAIYFSYYRFFDSTTYIQTYEIGYRCRTRAQTFFNNAHGLRIICKHGDPKTWFLFEQIPTVWANHVTKIIAEALNK